LWRRTGGKWIPEVNRIGGKKSSTVTRFRYGKDGEVGLERFIGWRRILPGIVVGGGWPEGYSSRWSVATVVGFATAMMFRHTGIEKAR
jgi:hypothetical protein